MMPVGLCQCGCGERTTQATKTKSAEGIRAGEYRRYVTGHNRRMPGHPIVVEDRGYATPCHIWRRSPTATYPQIRVDGVSWTVHVYFYVQAFGPVPEGYEVDHLCRIQRCCNIEHLEAVTPALNSQRANGKVTAEQRAEMRRLSGVISQRQIAERIGDSESCVCHILAGRAWRNEGQTLFTATVQPLDAQTIQVSMFDQLR